MFRPALLPARFRLGVSLAIGPGAAARAAMLALVLTSARVVAAVDGVPPTRFYPYEEIGCSASSAQLVHDPLGRIAVVQENEIIALNDAAWRHLWRERSSTFGLRKVARDEDGTVYFGSLGGWGMLRLLADGNLQPQLFGAPDAPRWVGGTIFSQILCGKEGVLFGGLNGVVFWERATGIHRYFEIPGVACVFRLGDTVHVSTYDNGLFTLDLRAGRREPLALAPFDREIARVAAGDGRGHLLVGTGEYRLFLLRGTSFVAAGGAAGNTAPGRLTAIVRLPEDQYAAAIAGFGIVLIEDDGTIRPLLAGPEYEGISSLANNEPGVLWAASERGVHKVLYGQPLTTFDRTLGLPIEWPQVAFWRGAPIVSSGGRIYESEPGTAFRSARFRRIRGEPPVGAWGIASVGESLLIGNGDGVFAATEDGHFEQIASGLRVARLVALDADTCLAIGADRIAALRRGTEGWVECAPSIAGVGYPYVVHAGAGAAWLELGVNRAARVSLAEGQLRVRLFEAFPWNVPGWINVSVVGTKAVLFGAAGDPLFLDGRTLLEVEAPELRALLEQVPWRVQRICADPAGNLWISHERGLCLARKRGGDYELDLESYEGVNGPPPLVRPSPEGGAWASTGSALHHLDPPAQLRPANRYRPVLVALREPRSDAPLSVSDVADGNLGPFRYEQQGVQFDFFSGSYAGVRPFWYEHRFGEGRWQRTATASSLVLPGLREGRYGLRVRVVADTGPVGVPAEFRFTVLPPWYRRWYAYLSFGAGAVLVGVLVVRLSAGWARRRHAALEQLVTERTRELRAAMDRLERETLTSATLAERNRLAAEIHDSLEQGFAGLSLQLETTAGLGGCSRDVQAGLAAARNMIAYCRDEVRHAVLGMHSPILDTTDLGAALERIVRQLAPANDAAIVQVVGEPRRIDPATEHHLLRIAQEAIANAVKHAAAKRLEIILSYEPTDIDLRVRDDGRGFDVEAVLRGSRGHLGVPSLRNRAAKIGGTIAISSQPGQGTTIHVRVPSGKRSDN
ncbi:MAG TPA: sensor histidine kinase [Opitutaceae bacterium]|nr:sensor histidine kinase [Opitutaceae bacterium]